MHILAVFNAKGGVAKTTSTINLGACLVAMGWRVLIVDLDYQGNTTTSLGFGQLPRLGSYDFITGKRGLDEVRQETFIPGLSLIGATNNLAAVDVELALKDANHDLLGRLLGKADDIDLVLLDCPPAMGVLTLNALVSCTAALIPSPAEPYAHDGLMRTWSLVSRIRAELNPRLKMLGILPTLIDPERVDEAGGVMEVMRAEFGSRISQTGVPRNDSLFSRAASHGVPACVLEPAAEASRAYLTTAARLMGRDETGTPALRCLDEDAPGALGRASDGLAALSRFRTLAEKAGLLDQAINLPQVSATDQAQAVAALEAALADPPPDEAPTRLPWILGGVGVALLGGAIGFAAGWAAAIGSY